jgi:hypothetical protein
MSEQTPEPEVQPEVHFWDEQGAPSQLSHAPAEEEPDDGIPPEREE